MPDNNIPLLSVRDLKTYFFQDEGTVKAVDGASFGSVAANIRNRGRIKRGKSVWHAPFFASFEPGRIVNGEILWYDSGGHATDLVKLDRTAPDAESPRRDIRLVFREPPGLIQSLHGRQQIVEAVQLHMNVSRQRAGMQSRHCAR